MAKDADEEFQIGKIGDLEELERLKNQLNASLESHSESMDENRRIEHERLLRKLQLKQIQLEKKKEAQVQLADAKGRGDDDAVQRIQEKYKADINNLKASADAEKRRQQDALANRLKRRREAKERELRRRHERETNELQMENREQAREIQESLEEDDQLQKISMKQKRIENAVNITNSKEEALALLDEQAKMRQAIQKRHDEEENKLEEEIEVAALVDKLDHEQDIALAQMKLEADMQATQAGIDENRQNARRKMLEKLSKQRQVAKARASDLKEKQNAFIKAQDGMTEVAKQSAIKKLNEMERRQQAMENEIEDGLKKFEQDISKFRDQTKNEQDMKRSMLKQKLEAKRQQIEALALKEQELAKRIQQQEANIDEQRRREIELEFKVLKESAMHWKDRFKANRKLMKWSRKEFVLT